MVDLSNYLLNKDLLLHRFTAFDDSAQNYTVWKVGFVNILKELKVSPIEESQYKRFNNSPFPPFSIFVRSYRKFVS